MRTASRTVEHCRSLIRKSKELESAQATVDDPNDVTIDEISAQLQTLKQQRGLTQGRVPQDKVKRCLRRLLSARDVKDHRNGLILSLTELLEKKAKDEVEEDVREVEEDVKDDVEDIEDNEPDKDEGDVEDDAQPSDEDHSEFNAEALLSDIFHVVENKLAGDDEAITEVCEGINKVFRRYRLI